MRLNGFKELYTAQSQTLIKYWPSLDHTSVSGSMKIR